MAGGAEPLANCNATSAINHAESAVTALPFALFVIFVSTISSGLLAHLPSRLRVPSSVFLFIVGMLVSLTEKAVHLHGDFEESIVYWRSIDPHTILFFFLPPLLYQSGATLDFHVR